MALSDKSISIARSWLGYKEGANNDTIFGKEFGMNFVAWCVQFVTDVYDATGLEAGKDYPYTASSGAAVNWYKENNSFNLSGGGYEPRSGDSVFFWDGSKVYHTGIVESVKDGIVSTIEGNAGPGSDSVVSNSYKLSDPKIYGFGTPKFSGLSGTSQLADAEYSLDPEWWKKYMEEHNGWISDPKMSSFYWKHIDVLDPAASATMRKYPGAAFSQDLAKVINGEMTVDEFLLAQILPIGLVIGGGIVLFMGINFLFGGSAVEIIAQNVKGDSE